MNPNIDSLTKENTVYGIAERRFNDGYIRAQIVAADKEDIIKNPHYREPVTTEYSTSLIHWVGNRAETEEAFKNARIALEHDGMVFADFPADDASEDDFMAWKEHAADGENFGPDDLVAKLIF